MTQYEVTFIVDPVLSGEESKSAAKTYQDMLTNNGGTIVNVDTIGLRSLAYPINRRTTGIYYCLEFQAPGTVVDPLELAMRRDERIMRSLVVKLDKFGVKYNEDKRNGKIGLKRERIENEVEELTDEVDTLAATNPRPGGSGLKPQAAVAAETVPNAMAKTDKTLEEAEAPVEVQAPSNVQADDQTPA